MDIDRNQSWYLFLSKWQRDLVDVSFDLSERHQQLLNLKDYSFIVFPMAKAYEGFLKKILLELNLISQATYQGRRFRIGRALNPDIRTHQKDEQWLYDDIAYRFSDEIARQMWNTWLECRNRVFHFFPDKEQYLSLAQAEEHLQMMIDTMSAMVETLESQHA